MRLGPFLEHALLPMVAALRVAHVVAVCVTGFLRGFENLAGLHFHGMTTPGRPDP